MRRGTGRALVAAWVGLALGACGGGTTDPPPPPPPPPPPGGPPPPPAIALDMAAGDVVTLTDPAEVRSFQIVGASQPREYEVIVQSATEQFGGDFDMILELEGPGAAASRAASASSGPAAGGFTDRELALRASSFELETLLRERTRAELSRRGARPLRLDQGGGISAAVAPGSPPQLGEMLSFGFGVDPGLFADCDSGVTVDAEVTFVGQNFTIAEDVQLAGQFTASDYQEIGQQLDDVIHPTVTSYFGTTVDIDDNQTVIALITAEVNKLSTAGSGSVIAGFFFTGDLSDQQDCAASNEGEIFYLIGPDPNGQFGPNVSLDFANILARTTVAHEFLHLINTQQRVTIGGGGFGDREDAWLDEGLAHLAEEISGLAAAGLGTRTNHDLDDVASTQVELDAFNDFHLLNFDRFGGFLYDGPHTTQALGDVSGDDPGGSASLNFRGFGYGFARWLGDRFGPAGSGTLPGSREEVLFRELSTGGPNHLRGTANVERAISVVAGSSLTWDELLASYLASLAVDDAGVAGIDPMTQFETWDMRGMYEQLNGSNLGDERPFDRVYPLSPTLVTLGTGTDQSLSFSVHRGAGRFVRLVGSGPTPDAILRVTDAAGAALGSSVAAQVTIIRTR